MEMKTTTTTQWVFPNSASERTDLELKAKTGQVRILETGPTGWHAPHGSLRIARPSAGSVRNTR